MLKQSQQSGFAAVVLVLILTLVALAIGITFSTVTFFNRSGPAQYDDKTRSYYAALGCFEYMRLQILLDPFTYRGDETVQLNDDIDCTVAEWTPTYPITLETYATVGNSTTRLLIETNTDLEMQSFQEY